MLEFIFKGLKVIKKSRKPFKSRKQVEEVVELTTNPNTSQMAVRFSDDSVCDIKMLEPYFG